MSLKPLFFASCFTLVACAGTPRAPKTKASPPDKAAPRQVKPDPKPEDLEQAREEARAPVVVDVEMMKRVEPGAELAPVMKSFEDKMYFDSVAQLDEHLVKARRKQGSIDYRLQTYAMTGQAHAMMGDHDLANRMYRKVLSQWQHPKALARKLQKKFPDDGDARVARSLDAFGEALFFVAERRRQKLDELETPYNDGGDSPREVATFVKRQVNGWVKKRVRFASSAAKEYNRISTITPGTPQRWVVAAHARKGLMAAQTLESVRNIEAPMSWDDKGVSDHKGKDGQPMEWSKIREDYAAQMESITKPLLESARTHYQACVDTARDANVDNAFVKSCKQWLKANR